ncbi:RHS repeat-associated core domain-containing protein [Pimelobacter simplex]|uniref:RHS repeat-associated core domain-containing protein n=1 Tax=Nocardioides simplex TaxID=2045 RepID=UPI0036701252
MKTLALSSFLRVETMRSRVSLLVLLALVITALQIAPGAPSAAGRDKPYVPAAQRYDPAPHDQTGRTWRRPAKPGVPRTVKKRGELPRAWLAVQTAEPGKPVDIEQVLPSADPNRDHLWTGEPLATLRSPGKRKSDLDGRYRIGLVDPATAEKLGSRGLVFAVTAEAGSDTSAEFALDYDELVDLGGTDWASRLQLVTLPGCALTTPERPACQTQTPLTDSVNHGTDREVRATLADVAVGEIGATTDPAKKNGGGTTPRLSAPAPANATVVAAVAGPGGSQGDYTASDLQASGSWSHGGSSGSFNWSYPVSVTPPAAGDVDPAVALSYSSAAVDGLNSNSNPQASWTGLGFDYQPGYIERTFRNCKEVTPTSTDKGLCWAGGDILTLRLPGGGTQALVVDSETGKIRPEGDGGERVERLTGAQNGGQGGEYWRVTTTDGTRYTFGANVLPGGTTAKATKSAWNVPVYGGTSADGCAAKRCTRTWRWNLDMVEDVHHNVAAYYYANEVNYFVPSGTTTRTAYDRGGYLTRIDYGITNASNSIYGVANPPNRVSFAVQERCNPTGTITCTDAQFVAANARNWPDVPMDQSCPATGGTCTTNWPTFWTRKKLATITSSYYSGTAYLNVDSYALAYSWSQSSSTQTLNLERITRTATAAGQTLTLPPVTFGYLTLDSRVRDYKALPDMGYDRLTQIVAETGARTQVEYGHAANFPSRWCSVGHMPAAPDDNDRACYAVNWVAPFTTSPTLDYFHKQTVIAVTEHDPNNLTAMQQTKYTYGAPAWHYDDNELIKPARRTWSQWRGYRTVETITGDVNHNAANGTSDQTTRSRATYYLGMDGDRLSGGGSRNVSFTDSHGTSRTDAEAFAGMPAELQTFDGSTEVSNVRHTPAVLATTAVRDRAGLPNLKARVVSTVKTIETSPGTGAGSSDLVKTTTTDFAAASSSEPFLQRPDTVTVVASGGTGAAQATCTKTSYADNTTTWMRGAPAEVSVYAQNCDAGATLVSRSRSYYDSGSALGGGNISAGDVTKTETATRNDSGTIRYATTTATYDARGRSTSQTVYPDGPATPATARTTSTGYGISAGGVITGVTTTLPTMAGVTGPVTNVQTLDPARGVPLTSTDTAGRVTSATMDALGRYTAVWKPGRVQGTHSASVTYAYKVGVGAPLAVTTKTLVDPGNGVAAAYQTSIAILDSRGILRQTQTDAPGGGRLVTDSYVDSHGWVVGTNDGWYTIGAPATTVLTTNEAFIDSRTTTLYDRAGRAVKTQRWKGAEAQPVATTSTVYGGDRTTVLPPSGAVPTTTLVNGLGQATELRRYTEPVTASSFGSADSSRTTYAYAPSGGVASMTTAAGTSKSATWSNTYDLLGRQVRADDPDSGVTTTKFDDTGSPTSTTDAAGRTVSTSYDAWGRPTARYAGTPASGRKTASWTYDTLVKGELTSTSSYVVDEATTQSRTYTNTILGYTASGLPTGSELSLNVPGFLSKYTTRRSYTATGLPATTTLAPTRDTTLNQGMYAEKLTHWYTALGLEDGLTGDNAYLTGATYTPYGEASQYVLGVNNSTSAVTYTRDPHNRWITNTLMTGQFADPEIANVAATYDKAGNTTRVVDRQGPPGAPTQTTCYRYDGLRQLTDAWSATDNCAAAPSDAVVGGVTPFWESWTHDAAGSRATQTIHALPGSTADDTVTAYDNGVSGHAHALSSATTTGSAATADTGVVADLPATQSATYTPTGASDTITTPDGDLEFGYRDDGSLGTIAAPGGDTTEYVNDVDGAHLLRIDRRGDTAETTLYLPGQQVTLKEVSGARTLTTVRYYALASGQQIAMRRNETNPVLTLADPHGTTQLTFAAFSTSTTPVVKRRAFDPYGNPLGTDEPEPWIDDRTFLNKPENPVTDLVDMGAREYDPATGRFTSVDPLLNMADPTQANGYNYANNNPITYSDPTGTAPVCVLEGTCNSAPNPKGGAPVVIGPKAATSSSTAKVASNGTVSNVSKSDFNHATAVRNSYQTGHREDQIITLDGASVDAGKVIESYLDARAAKGAPMVIRALLALFAPDPGECFGKDNSFGGCGLEVLGVAGNILPPFKLAKAGKVIDAIHDGEKLRDGERAADAAKTAPSTAIRPVGSVLGHVDDVMANPRLLEGVHPAQLENIMRGTPGWEFGVLGRGRSAGSGWTARELNSAGTDFTGRYIQWSPGSPRHFGGAPYWKISSGELGTVRFPQ